MRYFCNGMLQRGILMTPAHHWFLCAAMTEADMDRTAEAAAEVLNRLRSLE
jgi:glutamate-1-semialdehyde 2,1-aminomutase